MYWRPIESAPLDCEVIILDGGNVRTAKWSPMLQKFSGVGGNIFNWCEEATHWMPMPPSPLEQKNEATNE